MWAFWKLDWLIKHELFNLNFRRGRQRGTASATQDDPDHIRRLYGTAIPKNTPESSAWWKEQAKDLFALTEEHELGMMSSMVTITHNDLVPEMLANIRRGPFSPPTETEQIEYLLTRVRTDRPKSDFENYGMEHVLSYQRRIAATKERFMKRNHKTPLGIVRDYWDRTEAQMRAALHAHILVFFKPRETRNDFRPLPALERIVPGHEPRQRPRDRTVPPLSNWQADNVYQAHHVGATVAEMVRRDVSGPKWGG